MLHLSERQGMGGRRIFKVAGDNKIRAPSIDTNLLTIELIIWKVDIAGCPNLSDREKSILNYMSTVGRSVTTNELLDNFPQYKRDTIRRLLNSLAEKRLLIKSGVSVSTAYELNSKPFEQAVVPAIQTFLEIVRHE